MSIPSEPTPGDWERLYQAADSFRTLAPWDYMADTDLFAVVDPESGRTGYCSIFGAGGAIFGLAVFLGARGFETFSVQASSQEEDLSQADPTELMERLPYAIMATFEDKADLEPKDAAQIAQLGQRYSAGKAWPMFRLHEPGYAPWYLEDGGDVRFLAFMLTQAQDVVRRFKANPDLLTPSDPSQPIFTRLEREGIMVDTWAEVPSQEPARYPVLDMDELVQRVRYQKPQKTASTWEVDYFYLPRLVAGEESRRPEFPRVVLCMDRSLERAIDVLATSGDDFYREAPLRVFEMMLRRGVPRQIRVRRLDALLTLTPVAQAVGARLNLVEELPLANAFRRDLVEHLDDNRGAFE